MEALRQSKAQIASEDYNPGRLDMEAIEAALCEAVEMHDGLVSEDFIPNSRQPPRRNRPEPAHLQKRSSPSASGFSGHTASEGLEEYLKAPEVPELALRA